MTRGINRLGFLALALAAGSVAAYGQSTTTGALYGVVTDDKGNPVAGATVRLTSAQISRTEVTGANGSYRFGLLNPGQWRIQVTKPGLQAPGRDILIQTNTNHQANVKLLPVASTTVEVVATQVAAVDLTTTQTGSNYQMENMQALPMGRDMNTIANFAPGVASSGFDMGVSIAGASAAENSYVLDGLNTTDSRYGGEGNSLVTDFIDQVEVQTGGFKPEFSALGGVFNVITKSGTNEFKGTTWLTFDAKGMAAAPKSNSIARQGNPDTRYDIGAEVSGPIIKDKLFYAIGVDVDLRERDGQLNESGFQADERKFRNYQSVFKLNWFVKEGLQLTLSGNYNPYKDTQDSNYYQYGSAQAGLENEGYTMGINAHVDWTINSSLQFSGKIGRFHLREEATPTDTATPLYQDRLWYYNGTRPLLGLNSLDGTTYDTVNGNPTEDGALYGLLTAYNRGGYGSYVALDEGITDQFRADLSWFVGNHAVKFGVSHIESEYTEDSRQSGGAGTWILDRSSAGWIATAGNPNGFYARRTLYTRDATVEATYSAAYLQDTWDMIPGLKFAFGVRVESQEQKDAQGRQFLKFDWEDAIQPRVGMIWDPANDGKTKISLNWARYFEQIPQRMAMRQRGNEVFLRTWYALSSYSRTGLGTIGAVLDEVDYATPFSAIPIMDDIKLPQRDEVILGVDHTLENGWLMGLHAKRRKMKNPIEDFTPWNYDDQTGGEYVDWGVNDFGQAILGNPKSGLISWTSKPNSVTPNVDYEWMSVPGLGGYSNPKNIYESVDFTMDKKTERYYLSFSYTWSRLEGNYEGLVSSSNGQADANITASWDYPIYVGYGLLPLDRTNQVKFSGSYNWDLGPGRLTAGWFVTYSSGRPISQLTTVEDATGGTGEGVGIGNWTLPGNQIPVLDYGFYGDQIPADFRLGQFGRTPALKNTDIRLEYALKLGKYQVVPSIDIFNFFNSRKATGVEDSYTDSSGLVTNRWKMETGWQTGRSFRFGVKVRF